MLSYAQFFDELHIIVFAKKSLGFKEENIGGKLFLYPTQSRTKVGYMCDAIKVGKRVLRGPAPSLPRGGAWIVSTQDPFETGLVGVRLSRLFGAKLQVQLHTDFLSPYFKQGGLLNMLRRAVGEYTVLFADRIRVVSSRIQKGLSERLHIAPDKIDVVPIGVDVKVVARNTTSGLLQTQYPQFEQTVLMTSRLESEKNIAWAIASWKKVLLQFPKAGLVIVGEGTLKGVLQAQVAKVGFSGSVVFVPWQKELSLYFASATAFLSTSWYEGYGMTLVEAASAKCPIITTNVGLVGDVLSNESVILIDPEKKESLSQGVIAVLGSTELARTRAERAFADISGRLISHDLLKPLIKKSFETLAGQSGIEKKSLFALAFRLLHVDSLLGMLVKYVISGGTAAVVDLGTLYLFTDIFHIWYVTSSVLAFLIAFGISFLMQKFWTFRDHGTDGVHKQAFLYLAVSVFNLFLNTALVYALVEYTGIHYLPAQIITSALIACESFFVYKFIIFARE
jgi:glycosyltransferase involved in cell wall biosynthesis/putative flippase GtrA